MICPRLFLAPQRQVLRHFALIWCSSHGRNQEALSSLYDSSSVHPSAMARAFTFPLFMPVKGRREWWEELRLCSLVVSGRKTIGIFEHCILNLSKSKITIILHLQCKFSGRILPPIQKIKSKIKNLCIFSSLRCAKFFKCLNSKANLIQRACFEQNIVHNCSQNCSWMGFGSKLYF